MKFERQPPRLKLRNEAEAVTVALRNLRYIEDLPSYAFCYDTSVQLFATIIDLATGAKWGQY